MKKIITKPRGSSLIEVMIALVLGLLISASLINLFVSNKTTYRMQEGLAHVQETARFVHYLFSKDARMAGYQGCAPSSNITATVLVKNPPETLVFSSDDAVSAYQASGASWSPALPTAVTNAATGTDAITLRYGDPSTIGLKNPMAQPTSAITVYDRDGIAADDILMITDCEMTDIFQAGANSNASAITHSASNNTSSSLSKAYQTDAYIMRFRAYTYYIADTGRTNSAGQSIRALYRMDLTGNQEELAEGVENLQLRYGVDTDNDGTADTFYTADTIETNSQWGQVKSVEASFLINSVEPTLNKSQTYTFNGASQTATDLLYRREWKIHITLRNRVLGGG